MFITVGIDYNLGELTTSFVWQESIETLTIPISKSKTFKSLSIFLGGVTKFPTEFMKNIQCNCRISSFILDYRKKYPFAESRFDLRRTPLSK